MTYIHVDEQAALERMQRTITYHFAYNLCRACTELQKKKVYVREDLWGKHNQEVHHIKDDQKYTGVQFFSQTAAGLIHSQQVKVMEFLKAKAIEYVGGEYVVHPLQGYNKRTYHITTGEDGEMGCDCQFFRKERTPCSHIGAVREFMARGQGRG